MGLAARFTLFVAALLLGLTSAFVFVSNQEAERAANAAFEENAAQIIAVLDGVATGREIDDLLPYLQHVLNRIASTSDATRYSYVMAVGDNLETADPESLRKDAAAAQALDDAIMLHAPAYRRGEDVLHLVIPVFTSGQLTAMVRVGLSTESMENAISASVGRNMLVAIIFVMLALPLTALFISYATAPVRRLTQATRRVAAGDFSITVPDSRNDELGELSRSFAAMTKSIVDSFEAVKTLTLTDCTSGLANREQMRQSVQSFSTRGHRIALILMDVDKLKRVNEALGPDVGDDAIIAIAERLKLVVADYREHLIRETQGQKNDFVLARLGGDEFGILMCGPAVEKGAGQLAARVLGSLGRPFEIAGHSVSVAGSIGIAIAPDDGTDFLALMRSAANGLAEAKQSGRNTYKFARRDVNSFAYRRLVIEQELRLALEHKELEVFYQPQVALTDGAIIGAEALVRWRHPARGLVGPADFIEIAEEAGIIDGIGDYVLEQVCRQSVDWRSRGMTPRIALNVSASQCQKPDFAHNFLKVLGDAGVPASSIEMEITETVAMLDPRTTARDLSPLRAAGMRLAIDDFGTGYSNLASLTRMPIDVLKIDRSFVSECVRDGSARVVVSTILTMAKNLGFETIAEGVESAAQREFLLSQGCTYAQGFLFGRPVPAAEFEGLYLNKRRADARSLIGEVRRKAANSDNYRPA